MNRRNLFKLIGGALCAASIELTGIKPKLPVINSAYRDAQYEVVYIMHPEVRNVIMPFIAHQKLPDGPRYNYENGKWIQVNKYA